MIQSTHYSIPGGRSSLVLSSTVPVGPVYPKGSPEDVDGSVALVPLHRRLGLRHKSWDARYFQDTFMKLIKLITKGLPFVIIQLPMSLLFN